MDNNDVARLSEHLAALSATLRSIDDKQDRLAESIDRLQREIERLKREYQAQSDKNSSFGILGALFFGSLIGTAIGLTISGPLSRLQVVETKWKNDP